MKNPLLKDPTEITIQKEMMLRLRNAGDRHGGGGRKRRSEQMMQKMDGIDM